MKNKLTKYSLDKISKEVPFTLPNDYFEQFASNIDKQIAPKHRVHKLHQWLYAAAMFGGVITIGLVSYTLYTNNKTKAPLITEDYYDSLINAGVSEDLLVEYILNE